MFLTSQREKEIIFECNPPLTGRYLSIQKKKFGILEIDEVAIEPEPGNSKSQEIYKHCYKTFVV